jgi:hypothetical protein
MEKTGKVEETLLNLLQFNGYNSVLAFEGFFAGETDIKTLAEGLEASVSIMNNDRLARCVDLRGQAKDQFKLSFGQKSALNGLFKSVQKMIDTSNLAQPPILPATPTMRASSISTQRIITADNVQEMVDCILSEKILNRFNVSIRHFPIIERDTRNYPMVIFIRCFKCNRSIIMRVSREKKNEKFYYILRADNYFSHVGECHH